MNSTPRSRIGLTNTSRDAVAAQTPRGWGIKFREAFRGIGIAVRTESSFRIHLPMAVAVIVVATLVKCEVVEWGLLILGIAMVLAAEVFNSSLEALFHGLDESSKNRMTGVLDRAAGAVLIVSLGAAAVGLIIFGRRVYLFLASGPA